MSSRQRWLRSTKVGVPASQAGPEPWPARILTCIPVSANTGAADQPGLQNPHSASGDRTRPHKIQPPQPPRHACRLGGFRQPSPTRLAARRRAGGLRSTMRPASRPSRHLAPVGVTGCTARTVSVTSAPGRSYGDHVTEVIVSAVAIWSTVTVANARARRCRPAVRRRSVKLVGVVLPASNAVRPTRSPQPCSARGWCGPHQRPARPLSLW